MDDIIDNFDLVLKAFWVTIELRVLSRLASLVLGTLLRDAGRPDPVLAQFGALYVSVVRNTPAAGDVHLRLHRLHRPAQHPASDTFFVKGVLA